MKKTLLLFCSALALTLQAETITLDLTQPLNPSVIEFNSQDLWTETYNDSPDYNALEFQIFSFSHLMSGSSWGGTYWDGFSVSKVSSDTLNYNSCMAKGGLAGVGTPYLIAYYSDFMEGLNSVVFNDGKPYFPQQISVCQNPVAYKCITQGHSPARPFVAGDYFTLTIQPLDENYEVDPTRYVIYYLADYRSSLESDWTVNKDWESVDLSALGECYGLVFTLQSTDVSSWGMNTATCFALDGLTVSNLPTYLDNTISADDIVEWQLYTLTGQYLQTFVTTLNELRNNLSAGIYIARSGNYVQKIIK
ncbi:MAG: DUF4465 domain-containing protein [Paludibacter sp.]|nr:DUF4465 domain-containing protein [Bacteroidales bacterium]MCM1068618.1 DUF4465 domain-containing protein [Prevotella sp.]MCM1353282.1 DUF4465 domain-containing protein [Bacteroides sp.]MCM1442310.1 DUF4465 domain-containing protein [Muribaculum sp.]MCM1481129.1 DUF4465 domain-containing protein [Paludibacter sp.]